MFGGQKKGFAVNVWFCFLLQCKTDAIPILKPTSCQVLVCNLFHFICSIYAETVKQSSSLLNFRFGTMDHFSYQSWKLWINSSKKAMF